MKIIEDKDTYKIVGEAECESCSGSGLYIGIAEKDGAAVICSRCKGTGRQRVEFSYKKFTGRKDLKNVKRVYVTAAGYGISWKDITTDEGNIIEFSEAGCSYRDWKNGVEPKPIEDLHCPYMHTNQSMQSEEHKAHPLYNECCKGNIGWGIISKCKLFNHKNLCWIRYHKLMRQEENRNKKVVEKIEQKDDQELKKLKEFIE
jgi:hypothetical protein